MEDIHGETHFYHEDTLPTQQMNSPLGLFGKDGFHLNLQTSDAQLLHNSRRLEQLRRNNIPMDISSPGDFNFLKLASPDLEKMLLAFQSAGNSVGDTPPSSLMVPASLQHPSEAMESAKGLAEALQDLHDRQELHGGTQPIIVPQDNCYMENTTTVTDQLYLTTDSSGAITVSSNRCSESQDSAVTNAALGSVFGPVVPNTNDKQFGGTYVLQQFPAQNAAQFLPATNAHAQIFTTTPLSHPVEEMTSAPSDCTNAQLRALTAYNNVLAQNIAFPSQVYKLDGGASMFGDETGLEPIDLEVQEHVKRERKKQRNRVASSKCRKRKLEKEAVLEVTVKQLKARNVDLAALANTLKQQICDLKQRVMDHVTEGCPITLQHVEDPSRLLHEWDMTADQT